MNLPDPWELEKRLIAVLTEGDSDLHASALVALRNHPECCCEDGEWSCWFDLSPNEKAQWAIAAVRGES